MLSWTPEDEITSSEESTQELTEYEMKSVSLGSRGDRVNDLPRVC